MSGYGWVERFRQTIEDGKAQIRPLCRDEDEFNAAIDEVRRIYRTTPLDWPAAFNRVYHKLAAGR